MITGTILKQLAPSLPQAKADNIAALLEKVCPMYGINTADIFHEFIANLLEETGEFSKLEESLNYQAVALTKVFGRHRISIDDCYRYGRTMKQPANQQAIANILYGGEWGLKNLGNKLPNDGWTFRGGGPMQLTGRYLYTTFTNYYNKRFGTNFTPEQVADKLRSDIELGIHSACWEFAISAQLIDEAIADDFKKVVKTINGGYLNMDKRMMYYERAKKLIV